MAAQNNEAFDVLSPEAVARRRSFLRQLQNKNQKQDIKNGKYKGCRGHLFPVQGQG